MKINIYVNILTALLRYRVAFSTCIQAQANKKSHKASKSEVKKLYIYGVSVNNNNKLIKRELK